MNLPQISFKNNGFMLALSGLAILFVYAIIVPATTTYPFETVTKFQGDYPNPIYIKFHWESKDELMVGKLISVHADIIGLPYNYSKKLNDITMQFKGLNYFSSKLDSPDNNISTDDTLTFYANVAKHQFESKTIDIRYIIPVDESVELCDYNLKSSCMEIPGIIHPAPHDTFVQIDTGRSNAGVSIAILLATIVIVWHSLTPKNSLNTEKPNHQRWFMVILFISLICAIIIEYWFKWHYGDLS